jgi:hypothetical protein
MPKQGSKRRIHDSADKSAATKPLPCHWRAEKKETSSVYDCTVEDVEYICNSNSTLVD